MTQADGAAQDAKAQKTESKSSLQHSDDMRSDAFDLVLEAPAQLKEEMESALGSEALEEMTFGSRQTIRNPLSPVSGFERTAEGSEPSELDGMDPDASLESNVVSDLTGWIRVDDENVIRGWARDRADPSARKSVDIYIDEVLVGVIAADRLDPRLQEAGEGDGRHAFAVVVPEFYRTGSAHTVTAFVSGTTFDLRSKKRDFEIPATDGVPRIELTKIGAEKILGQIHNGQFFKSVLLEAWVDGVRQDGLISTNEVRRRSDSILDFEVGFALPAFMQFMSGGGVITAPGMVEAGLTSPVISEFADIGAILGEDRRLRLQPIGLLDPAAMDHIEVRARPSGESAGEPILLQDAVLDETGRIYSLPAHLSDKPLDISFGIGGAVIERLALHVQGPPRRVVSNGSFQHWAAGGPSGWTSDAPSRLQRGYYAFPNRIMEAQRIGGDTVWIDLEAEGQGDVVILRQALEQPAAIWSAEEMSISALVRASEAMRLTLKLRDLDADKTIAEWPLALHQPWSWQFANHPIGAPSSSPGRVGVELVAHGAAGASIEVAGLTISNIPGFADERPPVEAPTQPQNLVCNSGLTSWPHGLAVSASRGRFETAEGWYVLNRRTAAPVWARATTREEDDGFAFSFCAEEIADYCRLEISLGDALSQASLAHLKLEIASDVAARRLFRSSRVRLPEFLLVDRIMLLRRSTVAADDGFKIVDATVGIFARKVLVTRTARTLEFSIPVIEAANVGEFAWEVPEVESGGAEYLIVFEMRQPFALTIRRIGVTTEASTNASLVGPHLQLEDYAIAAQAHITKGLEAWVGNVSIGPLITSAPVRSVRRWDWGAAAAGTVEVVICVYNAIEETLACLESLATCTTVPHLVHLIDDGSDFDVERIEQFIAGRPWMRMSRNDANLGYTASANLGLKAAKSDWVVLLNSDTVVTPGWLEGLMECAASDPQIAFVGPVSNAATYQSVPELHDAKNGWKVNALPEGWTPDRMAELVGSVSRREFPQTALLNGFCTLMKRAVFMEVGGLNEGAFPAGYGEENDLCTRVIKAGYKLAVADHVYVYHSKSASFGAARRTELAKAGGKALSELHPEVNYASLGTQFRDLPALVALRHEVKQSLQNQIQGEI